MAKNLILDPNSDCQFFFFFKNLTPSVTRYFGDLLSCTISEKTNNDPILRKLSDRWMVKQTVRQTDRQTDRLTD